MPVQVRHAIWVLLGTTCFAQIQGAAPCSDAKDAALKLASRPDQSMVADGLGVDGRSCASSGYSLLAEEAFDGGRLAEASRYASAAARLLEAEPVNAKLLMDALRLQGSIYVERGMLKEARSLVERLKAMPADSAEQSATVRGLAGACYQAAGDDRAAELEYVHAIHDWDSTQRSENSVSVRSNLGVLYVASRRFDEAVEVLERAYTLLGALGKGAAYYRLVITNNLAVAYSERGDAAQAVRHARSAVLLADAAKVGRDQLTANVYFNSVGVLRAAGHKKEANELEYRASRTEAMAKAVVDYSELTGHRKRRP